MRRTLTVLAVLFLVVACGGEAAQPATPSPASTSETVPPSEVAATSPEREAPHLEAEVAPLQIERVGTELATGDPLVVHIRRTTAPNSFSVVGPFTETVAAQAVLHPTGRGGVNGHLLTVAVASLLTEGEVMRQLRLRAPRAGEGPPLATSSVSVSDDVVSFFDASVATDASGTHHVFLDVYLAE